MKKKEEMKWLALVIGWLLLIGLVAPWLISAESDVAVTIGIGSILAATYGTYRFVNAKLTNEGKDENEDA